MLYYLYSCWEKYGWMWNLSLWKLCQKKYWLIWLGKNKFAKLRRHARHVGHLVHLRVGHHMHLHVGRRVSHHVCHRNVVSTLCEVSKTPTESESMTDDYNDDEQTGLGARDTCVSKNFQMENQSQSSSGLKDFRYCDKDKACAIKFSTNFRSSKLVEVHTPVSCFLDEGARWHGGAGKKRDSLEVMIAWSVIKRSEKWHWAVRLWLLKW